MSTRPTLTAHKREVTGKAVAGLRREGLLPAVVYGHGHPSEAIQVDAKEFDSLRRAAGRHALVDLKIDSGRPRPVMIHGIQEHPVRRTALHVDLYLVTMTEEMTVDVPLVPEGVAPAVAKLDGTLLQTLDHVRVRALPADIPQDIGYDVGGLDSFDVAVHVRDLVLPPRVVVLTDPDDTIAHVKPPRVEAVVEVEEAAVPEAVPAPESAPAAEG